jgi:hypothetical protein
MQPEVPSYSFHAELWLYPGAAPWHFITLPTLIAEKLRARVMRAPRRGWGVIPVSLTIGITTWDTSIFPTRGGGYDVPIKKAVRTAEHIATGDRVLVTLSLR